VPLKLVLFKISVKILLSNVLILKTIRYDQFCTRNEKEISLNMGKILKFIFCVIHFIAASV